MQRHALLHGCELALIRHFGLKLRAQLFLEFTNSLLNLVCMVELLELFKLLLLDPRFHHDAEIIVAETFSFLMLASFRIFLL